MKDYRRMMIETCQAGGVDKSHSLKSSSDLGEPDNEAAKCAKEKILVTYI